MMPDQIALELLVIAAKLWPTLRDIIARSGHPAAKHVADVLPAMSESEKVAHELRDMP